MAGDVLELRDTGDAGIISERPVPVALVRPELPANVAYDEDCRLMPARGIALGIMLSLPIWALIIWGIWAL